MTYRLRIADLPSQDRPRERLAQWGAPQLSDAELLAILLATGSGQLSSLDLGRLILQEMGQHQRDPLERLRQIRAPELTQIHGVGPAKAATILAALELGKRAYQLRPSEKAIIDSPDLAAQALSHDLMWCDQERFAVVLLDVKNRLLGTRVITIGSATETLAPPKEVFRTAIAQGATRIILGHNHPSGNTEPSRADWQLTERFLQCGQVLEIPVLDHLILAQGHHQSLRQMGDLWSRFPQGD